MELAFLPDEVVLTVTDTGGSHNGAPAALAHTGGGYGIEGLRERAESCSGGTLTPAPSVRGGTSLSDYPTTRATPDDRGLSEQRHAANFELWWPTTRGPSARPSPPCSMPSPGIEVVGQAADGEEAVDLTHGLSPEVVLMDLRMPKVDGVAATRRIGDELPDVKVVVLTTFADDASILAALQAGAVGYLTKDAGREQIALAVRSAAAGQSVLDPAPRHALLRAACPPRTAGSPVNRPARCPTT